MHAARITPSTITVGVGTMFTRKNPGLKASIASYTADPADQIRNEPPKSTMRANSSGDAPRARRHRATIAAVSSAVKSANTASA